MAHLLSLLPTLRRSTALAAKGQARAPLDWHHDCKQASQKGQSLSGRECSRSAWQAQTDRLYSWHHNVCEIWRSLNRYSFRSQGSQAHQASFSYLQPADCTLGKSDSYAASLGTTEFLTQMMPPNTASETCSPKTSSLPHTLREGALCSIASYMTCV